MTGAPMDQPDPYDALLEASRAYRDRFGRDVWTWRMDPDRIPTVIQAMRAAMERGEALSVDDAEAITGVSPPPLGAVG